MSALESCIRRARRRHVSLLILEQGALATSIALGGAVLLLVLGTQILNWYWLVLLFGGSFAVGLYRMARRIPTEYVLAQHIDHRLKLHDTLSTAFHFSNSATGADGELLEAQRARAERAACDVVLEEAIPFRMPASAYASIALIALTGTLFAIRFGMRSTLDLSQPIVTFNFDTFRADEHASLTARKKTPEQQRLEEQLQGIAVSPDRQDQNGDFGEAPDSALDITDTPDVNNFPQDAKSKSAQKLAPSEVDSSGEEEASGDDRGQEGTDQAGSQSGPEGKSPDGAAQAKNASPQQGNQENSSLMDKMRDALANLMQKMKMQPQRGGSEQTASSKPGQQGNQAQQQMSQQGSPKPGSRQQGQAQADAQGDQEGEGGEKAENGQSKQGAQAADQQTSKDAKSGMGKQDGNKDVELAEQLEAMGKITEIFGKRAQNLTGEVMIEVAAGKQQLKTQYTQRSATHTEAGGEIHRDEIPLVYQHYVQQYFEQIRKAPADAKQSPAPKPQPPAGVVPNAAASETPKPPSRPATP